MRKIFLPLALALSLSMYVYAQQDLIDAANLKRYAQANNQLKKRVVFLGNSITEGWVRSDSAFFNANNYIGRGISGQTSPQLLLRFRQDVIELHPTAVVINIGTNDIAENTGHYTPQFTLDCIKSMAELARYNGIKVILSSVLPVGEYPWRKEIKDVPLKIDALNARIKSFAESNNFAYIDYNTPMRDSSGAMIPTLARDGIHPTIEGYKVMEKIAKKIIDYVIE
ncbi:MAG: SGNH/GDSL hydrolase family protein [Paludibacter sp.]